MSPRSSDALAWIDHLVGLVQCTDGQGGALPVSAAVDGAVSLLLETRASRSKAIVIGNGGSAAIASHLQTDLAHGLGVRALVFTEPSTLTAQANDRGYDQAFQNLTSLWAEPGDLMVAISSSGRSANILNACAAARAKGARLVTFSGFRPDNPLRALGDLNFHVSSAEYGAVDSCHAVLLHHLTDQVLARLSAEIPK